MNIKYLRLRYGIFFLCLIIYLKSSSQFIDPPGDSGPLDEEKKTIFQDNHACWPWAMAHQTKTVCCRRLQFSAHLYDNCWYDENELSSSGWNKLGKIAYEFTTNDEDMYKMHVGWRMKELENQQYLRLSLYYHENYYYVSHFLDEIPFNPDAVTCDRGHESEELLHFARLCR